MQKMTPCLWFDTEGEEAAMFYTSVFPNSRIVDVARYGAGGPRPEGTVMTVSFELDGQKFVALNGGPEFSFNEAISFQVSCETQEEVPVGRRVGPHLHLQAAPRRDDQRRSRHRARGEEPSGADTRARGRDGRQGQAREGIRKLGQGHRSPQ
jgi:hypothetical protein